MKISEVGLNLIREFEGLRLKAYMDSVGVPTIGYGHTRGVKMGDTCTPEEAVAWLADDVEEAEKAVNEAVTVPLTQNEFDALVSLVFNVGPGKKGVKDGIITLKNGNPSTLLRYLNAEDYDSAGLEILRWNRAGGQVLSGLSRRRYRESQLFETA